MFRSLVDNNAAEILAERLYERHSHLPLVDYHCHLPAGRISQNTPFRDIAELWLETDHYKWRAMRIAGESEELCSGGAAPQAKFAAWARTLSKMAGSPMQAWCRLELKRTFNIVEPLTPESADRIWIQANELLADNAYRPRELLASAGYELLCTTDDPADSLDAHRDLAALEGLSYRVLPTFRPDEALYLGSRQRFIDWLTRLEAAADVTVESLPSFLQALRARFQAFHTLGCRVSDHGLEHCYAQPCTDAEAKVIFEGLCHQKTAPDVETLHRWRSWFMRQLAEWNAEYGWTMLLHLGANRNNNSLILSNYGSDGGCDSIGDFPQGKNLVAFLDQLNSVGTLPKTILFNMNPRDTLMFSTIAGSFFAEGIRGKVQHGPPWWFLDQDYGIAEHFKAQSSVGVLETFVGMVTDSRSFLSSTRHDYFRQVVIGQLVNGVARGSIDQDQVDLDALCRAIFYTNAQSYFDWPESHGKA